MNLEAWRLFLCQRLLLPALREGDMAGVLAVLQQGLQTAEHQEFVERLNPQ